LFRNRHLAAHGQGRGPGAPPPGLDRFPAREKKKSLEKRGRRREWRNLCANPKIKPSLCAKRKISRTGGDAFNPHHLHKKISGRLSADQKVREQEKKGERKRLVPFA